MNDLLPPFEAYKGNQPFIFASYAHKDKMVVFQMLARLKQEGFRLWYDEGIDPGNEWPDEIAVALDNCYMFIVFISENSVLSQNVKNEINYALRNKKPFIVIYLAETILPKGLELQIGAFQAILKYKMEEEMYWRKLKQALPFKCLDTDCVNIKSIDQTMAQGSQKISPESNIKPHQASKYNWAAVVMLLGLLLSIGGGAFWFNSMQNAPANASKPISAQDQLLMSPKDSNKTSQANNQDRAVDESNKENPSVQNNLEELAKGEQFANQYDSIRVNLIKMLNNTVAGQGSIDDFYITCDTALAERQALLQDVQLFRVYSYNPQIYNELVNMLNYSVEYCTVCRLGADAINQSDDYGFKDKAEQAQVLSEKIQKSVDAYRVVIEQERKRLKTNI